MRGSTKYLMAIITACIITAGLNTASASGEDISDLKKLISVNEDVRMNSQDLAFLLATHNYNVVPKDGYVEIDINGKICKLVPNGDKPGLCDIVFQG
jgi:predicted small secreted protein